MDATSNGPSRVNGTLKKKYMQTSIMKPQQGPTETLTDHASSKLHYSEHI
jgi:hypothetical protein